MYNRHELTAIKVEEEAAHVSVIDFATSVSLVLGYHLHFTHNSLLSTTAVKKGKGRYSSSWEPHLRATGCHLPYGITQCYLPPDTSERAPPNPSHTGWY